MRKNKNIESEKFEKVKILKSKRAKNKNKEDEKFEKIKMPRMKNLKK
jgi:hypothetical protein